MPIITLYGSKGGTGRTTAAAALAVGLLAEGFDVTLVDTNPEYRWFKTWGERLVGSGVENCRVGDADHILHLAALERELDGDPNRFAIIDTPRDATDLRLMALAIADTVITPFGSYMDADRLVSQAAFDIPDDRHLVGLAINHGAEISNLVANWMYLFGEALPFDPRLDVLSPQFDAFAHDMLASDVEPEAERDDLKRSVRSLAFEARTHAGILAENPDTFAAAHALLARDASLSRKPEEDAA